MSNQFISPNWHPLLIHYPLAFLSVGILIELFSFLWPRGFFRAAGRWMILLGSLLAVPTLAAGIYAFRTAVGGSGPWHQAVQESNWTALQWQYMRMHIWLNSIGVGVCLVAVAAWVASTDLWRRRLYYPVLIALICALGLFIVSGWYGGESVYRLGTSVELSAGASEAARNHDLKWFIPPLELHIVLAGFAIAISVGAFALTLRRLERPELIPEPPETIGPSDTAMAADATVAPAPVEQVPVATVSAPTPGVYLVEPPIIHAGRFWMLAFLAALVTAFAGAWSVLDVFTSERLNRNWDQLTHPNGRYRLLVHAILGVSLIILPLILAGLARFGRRFRGMTGFFILLIVLVFAAQFWLGIALLYDTGRGPIYRFNPPTAAP